MNLNPFEALATFLLGILRQGKIQDALWTVASFAMSALVTGLGTWGLAILGGAGLLKACALAAVAVAGILVTLWMTHPKTKGRPLMWPGRLERERQRLLLEENVVSHGTGTGK